ncbi:MAG: hypothetical protein GXO23_07645 [Crenarchaeota archaeon]|nr:hypothetical protein [Thermoproteota archaeon]
MRELFKGLLPVLHNVTSVHRVLEFVRLCISFNCTTIIITRPTGAAAQQGLPEAFKIALKEGANIIVLSELRDIQETMNIDKIYLLTSEEEGEDLEKAVSDTAGSLRNGRKVAVAAQGQDLPFLPRERQLGTCVKILNKKAPSTSLCTIFLWELSRKLAQDRVDPITQSR